LSMMALTSLASSGRAPRLIPLVSAQPVTSQTHLAQYSERSDPDPTPANTHGNGGFSLHVRPGPCPKRPPSARVGVLEAVPVRVPRGRGGPTGRLHPSKARNLGPRSSVTPLAHLLGLPPFLRRLAVICDGESPQNAGAGPDSGPSVPYATIHPPSRVLAFPWSSRGFPWQGRTGQRLIASPLDSSVL
jgi:hypothetical protein